MFQKILIAALFFVFSSMDAEGQDRRFGAGALLGVNASQIQGDRFAGYDKLGLLGGLTAQVFLTEKIDISIEILYSQLGSRPEFNLNSSNDPFKIKLDYISVPVYVKYKDWIDEEGDYYKVHFFGGLSYGRLFGSEVESSDPGFVASQDFFKQNYIGILFGAIFYVNRNWGIGARWERSISRLYENDLNNPDQPQLMYPLWDKHLAFYVTYSL